MSIFSKQPQFDYKNETEAALESKFGKMAENVLHAVTPFEFGYDAGGRADVYCYPNHLNGIIYITCDLWGCKQKESDAGNYELMVALAKDDDWGPSLISPLAYYTLDASIRSGETMDLPPKYRDGYGLAAVIFNKYCEIKHKGHKLGIMTVIGITESEFDYTKQYGGKQLIEKLKQDKIYPMTLFNRG
jgi:hypothetical protein